VPTTTALAIDAEIEKLPVIAWLLLATRSVKVRGLMLPLISGIAVVPVRAWRQSVAMQLSTTRTEGVQAVPPSSPYHNKTLKVPARNVERAKALLAEAGLRGPVVVNLTVSPNPDLRQVAEIIQSMTKEAGFDVKINVMEFASSLNAAERGEFEAYLLSWSGRPDPDGNLYVFITKDGPQNYGKYVNPEVDALMDRQRTVSVPAERAAMLDRVMAMTAADRPILYLWHRTNFIAHGARLTGFAPVPDALVRLQGLKLAN
jgi:peptide/nickel transport system substrate-binding protein